MRARRPAAPWRSSRAPACDACSLLSFRLPRFGVDLELVFWAPLEEDCSAFCVESLAGRGLEVLPHDLQLAAAVEVDEVAGDHPRIDDVADAAGLRLAAAGRCRARVVHADLLGPDSEALAAALDYVRDTHEAGDEGARRPLVDLGRGADLLDPALVEDGEAVAHRQRLVLVVRDVDEGDPKILLQALEEQLHLLAQLQVEAPRGSSSSSTCGRLTSARASATRWRWPPESWLGLRSP